MSDNRTFRVSLHGEKSTDLATVAKILSALDGLFREVCREMTGVPDAVILKLVGFSIECDRCGAERAEGAVGWTKQGADVLCSACSQGAAA